MPVEDYYVSFDPVQNWEPEGVTDSITRGESYIQRFVLKDTETGVAVDLSDYSVSHRVIYNGNTIANFGTVSIATNTVSYVLTGTESAAIGDRYLGTYSITIRLENMSDPDIVQDVLLISLEVKSQEYVKDLAISAQNILDMMAVTEDDISMKRLDIVMRNAEAIAFANVSDSVRMHCEESGWPLELIAHTETWAYWMMRQLEYEEDRSAEMDKASRDMGSVRVDTDGDGTRERGGRSFDIYSVGFGTDGRPGNQEALKDAYRTGLRTDTEPVSLGDDC